MCKNSDKNKAPKPTQRDKKPDHKNFEKNSGKGTKISTTGQETGDKRPKYD